MVKSEFSCQCTNARHFGGRSSNLVLTTKIKQDLNHRLDYITVIEQDFQITIIQTLTLILT